MKIIDISVPIKTNMPRWPGDAAPRIKKISHLRKGDESNVTNITMGLHTGTHIDAPLHFLERGDPINAAPLSVFSGPVFVAHVPKARVITAEHVAQIPRGAVRVLFKTSNSNLWRKNTPTFKKEFVGLSVGAAQALARRRMLLVGVDYLSVAAFSEVVAVHEILLKKNIALLEGINLTGVVAGKYELICLPLFIPGVEAAPCRAVLFDK